MPEVGEMKGLTMERVTRFNGDDGEELRFTATNGRVFRLYHDQDCCESVSIEEISGDLADLEGHPLLEAEELSNEPEPAKTEDEYQPESYTWTFYRFTTIKGTVRVRWYGESNGYYSERVDFEEVTPKAS